MLGVLSLSFSKYSEYNGSWYTVHRDHFDLFMLEEPYHSLVLLVNIDSGQYIVRVLGTTR